VSPLSLVHTFLMGLMNADKDGRVVLERPLASSSSNASSSNASSSNASSSNASSSNASSLVASAAPLEGWSLKFVLLNPALHFKQLASEARAVVLLGGTMQPFDYITAQLLDPNTGEPNTGEPSAGEPNAGGLNTVASTAAAAAALGASGALRARAPVARVAGVRTFACGHVIPPESILPLALGKGPTGLELNFTYKHRATPAMVDELGRCLFNVCCSAPGGVVAFLPSFDYEKLVVGRWASTGLLERLQGKKPLFREPKQAAQLENTLQAYSTAVREEGGALLLCVVGAKMSEGINFSDDLARCVVMVGLPYPDCTDPELQQKMAFLDDQQRDQQRGRLSHAQSGEAASSSSSKRCLSKAFVPSAGQEYYENLCMRAVNQSIGRAIRHRGDFAAIVLLDRRFVTKKSVVSKLPKWIGDRVTPLEAFGPAVRHLRLFFAKKRSELEKLQVPASSSWPSSSSSSKALGASLP